EDTASSSGIGEQEIADVPKDNDEEEPVATSSIAGEQEITDVTDDNDEVEP
ncbi:hypothetical protein MKX01_014719, partial [Papaver californicum]